MLHDLAILESHVPALNELTVVHIRLGAVDDALYTVAVRRAEHFLGGHVGNKFDAPLRLAGSALPGSILGDADGQISAVATGDVHTVQVPGVELIAAGGRLGHMLFPGGDRVTVGNTADIKDDFPQFLHGLVHRQFREHLGCPARCRNRHHAPLHAVVHGVFLPGLHEGAAGQVDAVDLACIQAGQRFRVGRMDGQRAAAIRVLGVVQVAAQLVGFQLAQVLFFRQFHMQAAELIILPADDDLLGPSFVPGAHTGVGEIRHGDRAADDKILARTHIDAHLDNKISIQLQIVLVHGFGSPFVHFAP